MVAVVPVHIIKLIGADHPQRLEDELLEAHPRHHLLVDQAQLDEIGLRHRPDVLNAVELARVRRHPERPELLSHLIL